MNKWAMAALTLFLTTATQAAEPPGKGEYLPMPPTFSIDGNRDQILNDYPLGVITREAAFSHHGQAHKVISLPNGLEGWVYELSLRKSETFTKPSGEKQQVTSLEHSDIDSTYTLVFDSRNVVIDVLYRDPGRADARSALLVQQQANPDVEKEPWRSEHLGKE